MKSLLENIKNLDFKNIIIDESEIEGINKKLIVEWKKSVAGLHEENDLKLMFSMYYLLNNEVKTVLSDFIKNLPIYCIDLPSKNINADFVVNIKDIFTNNKEQFSNIKECADWLEQFLSKRKIKYVEKIAQVGIFVNILLSDEYYQLMIDDYFEQAYDQSLILNYCKDLFWKICLVDYSSPNMAKQMSVWHFRSTIIWEIILNMLKYLWIRTLWANYLWDWWTPFGKLIYTLVYYSSIPESERPTNPVTHNILDPIKDLEIDPIGTMWFLYASFKDIPEDDKDMPKDEYARKYFKYLEKWEENLVKLWEILRRYTIMDFNNIYKRLDISFDCRYGEAFTQMMTDDVMIDLEESEYLREENWAFIVRFEKKTIIAKTKSDTISDDDLILVIKKSDGSTLYSTRDLVNVKFRIMQLKVHKIYIVVWQEQKLYFNMIFELSYKLWYVKDRNQLFHVEFWHLLLNHKKISSRLWNVIRLWDMIDEVKYKILKTYHNRIYHKEAEILAISATIFNDIKNDRLKSINFDIDKMSSLNWDTWIYLHYTMVRLKKLIEHLTIKKVEKKDINISDMSKNLSDHEKQILKHMSLFNLYIIKSVNSHKPHILAQYVLELSQEFNSRYANSPKLLDMDEKTKLEKFTFLSILEVVLEDIFKLFKFKQVERM